MWYEMVEKLLRQLMTLLRVDTSYFASRVPVVKDIATILLAVGWALLIGNLAYQALRSMASGVGIEARNRGRLFLRTAMFSFLLVLQQADMRHRAQPFRRYHADAGKCRKP